MTGIYGKDRPSAMGTAGVKKGYAVNDRADDKSPGMGLTAPMERDVEKSMAEGKEAVDPAAKAGISKKETTGGKKAAGEKRKRDYGKIKDNIKRYQDKHPRITLSMPKEDLELFKADAARKNMSVNRYFLDAAREYMKKTAR